VERKHTPEPWIRVPQSNGSDLIAHEFVTGQQMTPKGLRLVAFTMARGSSLAEDEANARLIVAAPKLLRALRELHEKAVVGTDAERHAALNQAWEAIAEAEGA
jgi:hypothetical protein